MFDEEAVSAIKDFLEERKESISAAESVTAGLIQAALSTAQNASAIFEGGVTAYNLTQKFRHLHVDMLHAQACNSVSKKVAAELAINVTHMFNSVWGVGITGYASVTPESGNQLFAHFALAHSGKVVLEQTITSEAEEGLPTQLSFANQVLGKLAEFMKSHDQG
jgi:nicotinamide-nucleotide amidase